MSRSILLSIIISVLLLGIFTLVSKEYRTTATQTALERPRIASATAPAENDAPIHKSATPVIVFDQPTQ